MSGKLLGNTEEFLLGKPKWRGLFGRSRHSKEISKRILQPHYFVFLHSLDRPEDGYKTVIETRN